MPKFPPPPRTPQNRSGLTLSLAVTSSPSAVTRSTESRLSTVAPYLRISQPMPPPSVRPAMPVWVTIPPTVASPWSCVSRSSSPQSTPACARAVLACGSTLMPFIGERSITSPRRRPHARRRRDHRSGPRPADRARARSAPPRPHRPRPCSGRCRPDGGRSRHSRSCGQCRSRGWSAAAALRGTIRRARRTRSSPGAVPGVWIVSSSPSR